MSDLLTDFDGYPQDYASGSGRRRQHDRRTESSDAYRHEGTSIAVLPDFQLDPATAMISHGQADLRYYSAFQQQFPSTQGLGADTNVQPGTGYPPLGAPPTTTAAPGRLGIATDLSAQGFYADLREKGMTHDTFDEFGSNRAPHLGSMPSEFNEFDTSQDFGTGARTSSDYGQGSLGTGSYDFAPPRQSSGAASSSYLTVPNSVGTGSYAASDVFSDRDSNIFPFGLSVADSFTACPDRQRIAPLVGSRQRSASSAMIGPQRPSSWNFPRYSASNLHPNYGMGLPQAAQSRPAASSGGYYDLPQSSPTSLLPPESESMSTMSSSDLPLAHSLGPSEPSCASAATPRHRSYSASYGPTMTRDARVTRHSTSGRTARQITTSRSPNRGRGTAGDDRSSRHSLARESSLRKGKDKGRRTGPMEQDSKRTAKERREKKDRCQSCLFKKIKCVIEQGETACKPCAKRGLYCIEYHFKRHRTTDFFDILARSYFNHVCDQGRSRRWTMVESIQDFDNLLGRLERAQSIGFMQCWFGRRLLYTIDMQRCVDALRNVASASDHLCEFGKSLDETISAGDSWLQFYDNLSNVRGDLHDIQRMLDCTELLPWHTFTVFDPSVRSGTRALDPSNDNDLCLLRAGTLLSRLIARQLEQAGFEQLHKQLTDPKTKPSGQAVGLLKTLLLSLRRRWCMWEGLPDLEDKADWSHRVYRTTEILYFLLFHARDPPAPPATQQEFMRQTVWQDLFPVSQWASPQEEDTPTINSPDGFRQWLSGGFVYLPVADAQLGQAFRIEHQAAGNDFQYEESFYA